MTVIRLLGPRGSILASYKMLAMIVGAICLISICLLGYLVYFNIKNHAEQVVYQNANQLAASLESDLYLAANHLASISDRIVQSDKSKEAIYQIITSFPDTVFGYGYHSTEGVFEVGSKVGIVPTTFSLANRDYVKQSMMYPHIMNYAKPAFSTVKRQVILPVSTGVIDDDRQVIGLLAALIYEAEIEKSFRDIITDQAVGYEIMHTDGSSVMRSINFDPDAEAVQRKVGGYPYTLKVTYNSDIIFAEVLFSLLPAIIAGLLVTGFVCAVLYHLHRQVLVPVQQYSEVASAFSEGKNHIDVPKATNQEFASIAEQLLKLQELLKEKEEKAQYLTQLTEQTQQQLEDAKQKHADAEKEKAEAEKQRAEADKLRKEAEEYSKIKSNFLANMSHELRTPLTAINGYSEMLFNGLYGKLDEGQSDAIRHIYNSGRHLIGLVNDILDLSSIEAGKMKLSSQLVDMNIVVEQSAGMVKRMADKKGITLRTLPAAQCPPVEGDERRLKQVLLNLMSNAVKYTPQGGEVSISVVPHHGKLTVTVEDNGKGMTAEELAIALSRYGRTESSLTSNEEGSGLGLPLSHELVKLHGGQFDIRSVKGEGTAVSITFNTISVSTYDEPEESDIVTRFRVVKA